MTKLPSTKYGHNHRKENFHLYAHNNLSPFFREKVLITPASKIVSSF